MRSPLLETQAFLFPGRGSSTAPLSHWSKRKLILGYASGAVDRIVASGWLKADVRPPSNELGAKPYLGAHQCFVQHRVAGTRHPGTRLRETVSQIAVTGHHSAAEPLGIGLANSLSLGQRGVGSFEPVARRRDRGFASGGQ